MHLILHVGLHKMTTIGLHSTQRHI